MFKDTLEAPGWAPGGYDLVNDDLSWTRRLLGSSAVEDPTKCRGCWCYFGKSLVTCRVK